MVLDIEKQCLRFSEDSTKEEAPDDSVGERQDLFRLRQFNFMLPELSHLRLKQIATELNLPMYPVARVVFFLGIQYFLRDMKYPKTRQWLLEFMEDHSSLKKDRKEEFDKGV